MKFFLGLSKLKPSLIGKSGKEGWQHVARTGNYNGYHKGPFKLTSEMLDQMIGNFDRASDSLPVFQGHADLYSDGAPAYGWIRALKREGSNLLALIEFTPEMAEAIQAGKYKYTSIFFSPEHMDGESGKGIGACLYSVAVTNSPFIKGLKPLEVAASKKQTAGEVIYLSNFEPEELSQMEQQTNQTEEAPKPLEMDPVLQELMALLMEASGKPEASPEEMVALLREKLEAVKAALGAEEQVEEEPLPAEEPAATQIAASTALSLAMSEINGLKAKLASAEAQISAFAAKALSVEMDALVSSGRILDSERPAFTKLAQTDRALFSELLAAKAPAVPLKRIVAPTPKETGDELSEYRIASQKATGRYKKK